MKFKKSIFETEPYFNFWLVDDKYLIQEKENSSSYQKSRFKTRGYRRPLITTGITKKDKYYTELNPYYRVQDVNDITLVFESRFESGNLKRVIQVTEFE